MANRICSVQAAVVLERAGTEAAAGARAVCRAAASGRTLRLTRRPLAPLRRRLRPPPPFPMAFLSPPTSPLFLRACLRLFFLRFRLGCPARARPWPRRITRHSQMLAQEAVAPGHPAQPPHASSRHDRGVAGPVATAPSLRASAWRRQHSRVRPSLSLRRRSAVPAHQQSRRHPRRGQRLSRMRLVTRTASASATGAAPPAAG